MYRKKIIPAVNQILKIVKDNYNAELVETWYSILSAFKHACPCYQAGFVDKKRKSSSGYSLPKDLNCPLNQYGSGTEACLFCKFSNLYASVTHFSWKNRHVPRLSVYLYLQRELAKLIVEHRRSELA